MGKLSFQLGSIFDAPTSMFSAMHYLLETATQAIARTTTVIITA